MSLIRKYTVGVGWETVDNYETQSAEVTVDAASADGVDTTFVVPDLSICRVRLIFLSYDLDGETLGPLEGQILFDTESIMTSSDPAFPYTSPASVTVALTNSADRPWEQDSQVGNDFDPPLPAQTHAMMGQASGYIQIRNVIFTGFDEGGGYYAGSNNPTATWRVEVTSR